MKKTNAGKAISKTVDEYLEGVSEPGRTTLSKLLSAIRSVAPPETTEGMVMACRHLSTMEYS
jgi:hypothetical protein